nr:MAG TPA: hypothetical protein [Caudoviricetes sp.]
MDKLVHCQTSKIGVRANALTLVISLSSTNGHG